MKIRIHCLKPKPHEVRNPLYWNPLFHKMTCLYSYQQLRKSVMYAVLPLVFDEIRGIASCYQIHFKICCFRFPRLDCGMYKPLNLDNIAPTAQVLC